MGKATLLYKDKAGNKLYRKYIKTRKTWQIFGKNRKGKLVNKSALSTLLRKSKLRIKKR